MNTTTPENRSPAPGALLFVHEFMNSAHLAAKGLLPQEIGAAIRERRANGESQVTLAAEYGLTQGLVAAVGRGARLEDDLATPRSAADWLTKRGLLPEDTALREEDVITLRELRQLLRELAVANNGEALDPDVLPALDQIASQAPLTLRFDAGPEPVLRAVGTGIDGAVAGLLGIVHAAMRDGTFQRLKRCPGDGCPHTFYDWSRNRTGTWCSMSVCGNRTKVRSYQSRRRAARRPARA
ncbi:MAG: CGNR zinc finger domain-containing protein [Dehalococcoidia bacterium]